MLNVTRLAWMGNTTSLKEVIVAPLNPDNKSPGFSRADGSSPFAYRPTFVRDQLNCPDQLRFSARRIYPLPVLGSKCLHTVATPNWYISEKSALNEANLFCYRIRTKQPSPLSLRVVLVIYWTSMYIVNDNPWAAKDIGPWAATFGVTSLCLFATQMYCLRCLTLMRFSTK